MVRNPSEIALETVQTLIQNPGPAKGEPFPKIPGPKKDDKVFIKQREKIKVVY